MDIQRIKKLLDGGYSYCKVAKVLKLDKDVVIRESRKAGLISRAAIRKQANKGKHKCPICGKTIVGKYFCSINCKAKDYRDRLSRRRKLFVELAGGKCIKCGYNRNWAVLQFHHKDHKKKKFALSGEAFRILSDAKIFTEISKCDLLCSNCHSELHNPDKMLLTR